MASLLQGILSISVCWNSAQLCLAQVQLEVGMDTVPPEERARLLVTRMTLDEKIAMLYGNCGWGKNDICVFSPYIGRTPGNTRLGIPPLHMAHGPQGFHPMRGYMHPHFSVYDKGSSTAFPSGLTMAASWDPGLVYEWGAALGREFHMKGSNLMLGPAIEIVRVPHAGRNYQSLSGEDPYLSNTLVGQAIRGIQSQNVIANAKHWILNQQETNHGTKKGFSAEVDERTLHELYYAPFKSAIEAGVGSFMCSNSQVAGAWSCANPSTLRSELTERFQFQGFILPEWRATHHTSFGLGYRSPEVEISSLDFEMSSGKLLDSDQVYAALIAGNMSEADIDDEVSRILWAMYNTGVIDESAREVEDKKFVGDHWIHSNIYTITTDDRAQDATRRFSASTTVLLKNEDAVLPLPDAGKQPNLKLALIGFAGVNAIIGGLGVGAVPPSSMSTPIEGIRSAAGAQAIITYSDGVNISSAAALAKDADYAIVFVGTTSDEGVDRESLSLDTGCAVNPVKSARYTTPSRTQCAGNANNQNALVSAVAASNSRSIVVASVPGATLMPWSGEVSAILVNFMPGQQVGNAIADILFGKVNPSARLPITFPNHEHELNFSQAQFPGIPREELPTQVSYKEQLLVGYRYYDANNINFTTGFPFGHGLSYTAFEYTDLAITNSTISFSVTNAGLLPGAEVAQVYLRFPAEAGEPFWVLKRFQKTQILQPGESLSIGFDLTSEDLSIWDVHVHDWAPVVGVFGVRVGSSSRDIRLEGEHHLQVRPRFASDPMQRTEAEKPKMLRSLLFISVSAMLAVSVFALLAIVFRNYCSSYFQDQELPENEFALL